MMKEDREDTEDTDFVISWSFEGKNCTQWKPKYFNIVL